ncbi:PREDICTED: defensin-A-like [Rhagoletis zephyria]|uniref:defensin-A-like n=1 Tax=Rhagoletis zephyria TaxID=28612 RepID=UPI0008113C34|nr:PREDICTED: defensin-A-like [Rhagoletis zephyria]
MKTTGIIFVTLCSILVLRGTAAHPEGNKDITIDAAIQSSAHIEIPESVAEELLKAVVEAFNNMKISGESSVQSHVSIPEEKPKLQSRSQLATCDLMDATGWSKTLCAAHCILLGHRGGYCNGRSICVCRD